MSDKLQLQLDGAELVRGVESTLAALQELKAAIAGFATNDPTGRVRAEVQTLATSAVTVVQSVEKTLGGVRRAVDAAMQESAAAARNGGKKVGKQASDGIAEGLQEGTARAKSLVKAQVQQLQAEYEAALARGWKVKPLALQELKLQGVHLGPDDRVRLNALVKDQQTASRQVLAMQRQTAAEVSAANLKAWQDDLAGYHNMLRLRAGADVKAANERAARVKAESAANLRAWQDDLAGYQSMLRLKVAAEQATAGRIAAIRMAGLAGAAQAQVNAAMLAPAGAYGMLGGAKHGATVVPGGRPAITEVDNLAQSMRGAHSAARGLASGFNAMWLTWGQLGPLLAGALVSNAFVQSIKQGAQFEQTLSAIGYMAGVSAQDLDKLSSSALELARVGPFGPNEIAKALKALALAGLTAKEQIEAIKPVMNFSIAGELPVEKAAESLVAISTAFGYSATGFGAVGDVIAKAAAISMASVESMTESFKTASTVAQQYGVSVTDAATSLALLSQMGIKGTAAGTAMRNMYRELIGSSKEAQKVLRDVLKIDVVDSAAKAVKPLAQILTELSGALAQYDFRSQIELLQKLGNERGMKTLAADLTAFVTAAKESGKDVTTEFQRIQAELQDAPGFIAMAAAGMAQTTANQMKSVGSALQSTLVEAFQVVSAEVQTTSKYLRDLFNSPEFRSGVESVISSLAGLVKLLVEHADWLKAAAVGYVGGKAALTGYALAVSAASAAQVALGASSLAASAGVRLVLASLGPIGAALALAGTAYLLFSERSETATDKAAKAAKTHSDSLTEAMDKEIKRLDDQMRARREGVDASISAAKAESDLAISRVLLLHDEERAAERARHAYVLLTAQRTVDKIVGTPYAETAQGAKALAQAEAQVAASRGRIAEVTVRQTDVEQGLYEKQRQLFSKAQQDAREAEEDARRRRGTPTGNKKYTEPDYRAGAAQYKEELRSINLFLEASQQVGQQVEEEARFSEAVLHQAYERGALSFTDYQDRLNAVQADRVSKRLAIAREEHDAVQAAYEDLRKKAGGLDPSRSPDQKLANDAAALQGKLEKSSQAIKKITDDAYLAQGKVLTETLKPSAELVRNSEKELAALQNNLQQEMQRLGVKENINLLSEREQFIQAEVLKGTNAMVDKLTRYQAVLKQQLDSGAFNDLDNPEVRRNFESLLGIIDRLKAGIRDASGELRNVAGDAFDAKKINEIAKGLNDGFTNALFEGSGRKLRKTLEQELLRKPFQMAVQALLQPITQGIAGAAYGAIAGPNGILGGTPLGAIGNAASIYNAGSSLAGIGSAAYGGYMAGASGSTAFATSLGVGNAGLGASGLAEMATAGTAVGTGGVTGGIVAGAQSALAAIPVWGWALAATAILSSILKKGGGPKQDGVSGSINSGIGLGVRTPELEGAAALTSRGIQSQFDVLQRQLGGTGAINFGVGISTDPKGDSPSFLDVTGSRGGQTLFTSLNRKVGRSEQELQAALSKATTEAIFSGLRISNLEKPFADFFAGIAADADLKVKEAALKTASEVASYTDQIRFLGGVFENLTNLSVQTRGALLDAAGGLSALSSATGAYVQNFYTTDERRAITAQGISRQLGVGGLDISADQVMGATRAQLRGLVDSLDVTTDAGRRSYLALMSVADAFASISEPAEEVRRKTRQEIRDEAYGLETQLLQLEGNTIRLRERELELLDPSNRARQREIWALEDRQRIDKEREGLEDQLARLLGETLSLRKREREALDETNRALFDRINAIEDAKSETDKAYSLLERAVKRQQKEVQQRAEEAKKSVELLKPIFELLRDQVKSLYEEAAPKANSQWGRAFIDDALGAALKDGSLPDKDELSRAIDYARSGMTDANYDSSFDARVDRLVMAGKLAAMRDIAGNQLSDAERLQKVAEDQLEDLDNILEAARDQIDRMRGIDLSVISVREAIDRLAAALMKEGALTKAPLTTLKEQAVSTPFGGRAWQSTGGASAFETMQGWQVTGVTGNQFMQQDAQAWVNEQYTQGNILGIYQRAIEEGISANSLNALMGLPSGTAEEIAKQYGLPKFADGGWHSGGWAMVGEEGPELAYMPPSRIYTADQTRSLGDNGSSTEIRSLREEQRIQSAAIAQLTTRMVKIFERWESNGMPETRAVV